MFNISFTVDEFGIHLKWFSQFPSNFLSFSNIRHCLPITAVKFKFQYHHYLHIWKGLKFTFDCLNVFHIKFEMYTTQKNQIERLKIVRHLVYEFSLRLFNSIH